MLNREPSDDKSRSKNEKAGLTRDKKREDRREPKDPRKEEKEQNKV